MDLNSLFSSDWWNSPMGKSPVATARDELEPVVGPMRNGAGSLDPANVTPAYLKKYGIAPSASTDVREIIGLGQMRSDAMKDTYKLPAPSPLEFLGSAMSAASVPVAYAQGNTAFGNSMAGRTLADQAVARKTKYQDLAAQDHRDIVADTFGSVDKTVQSIQANRRERQQRALSGAEVLIRQGKTADAITLLKTNGLTDHATELESRLKGAAQGQGPGFQNAPATQPATPPGGPVSSPVPGISITSPQGAAPAAGPGAPAMPGAPGPSGPPGPPQASGVAGMGIPAYQPSPEAKKLLEDAAFAESMGRPDLAKQMEEQAKLIDTPRSEAAKSQAQKLGEGEAERTNKEIKNFEAAPKVGELFDMLGKYSDVKGFDYYTGAWQGSSDYAPFFTDNLAALDPSNKASPAIRDQIRGTQMALVNILKANIRTPGEGSQDQREFQAVIDTIGDMTNANTEKDYRQKLNDAKARVEAFTGVSVPTSHKVFDTRTSAAADQETAAPGASAAPAAQAPMGEVRLFKDGVRRQKTPSGWVPVGEQSAPPPVQPVNKATFLRPQPQG
jgi:hypothetical protein